MNQFLSNSMLPLMQLIKRHDGWNYTPPGSSELKQKYVGLRNLGCICYMNSMLQQFFMIPAFRYGLLSVDDKLPEELVEYKGQRIDDNVLHQL
jgi:ubiquitin carboxyl-terminal hydrolase 34